MSVHLRLPLRPSTPELRRGLLATPTNVIGEDANHQQVLREGVLLARP